MTDVRDHLPIDIADPEDIRRKLPQARILYQDKRKRIEQLMQDVQHWETLINSLAMIVGEEGVEPLGPPASRAVVVRRPKRGPSTKRSPAQDRAVEALGAAGGPMGPTALFKFMLANDMDAPSNANALGAALWAAAKAGRVQKTPDDLYAPPNWEPDQNELQASRNGQGGQVDSESKE